jgi:hypothetical protein
VRLKPIVLQVKPTAAEKKKEREDKWKEKKWSLFLLDM